MSQEEPQELALPPRALRSSRQTDEAAGWRCTRVGTFTELLGRHRPMFSWLGPGPLIQCRNDPLARLFHDPVDHERRRWVAGQLASGASPDFTVRTWGERSRISFMLLGDTGEGDASQYCVIPGFLRQAQGTDFAFIVSDVIYPAGISNDYLDKFYRPYQNYEAPILAIPGNHDWYDNLYGFMRHFCGTDGSHLPPPTPGPGRAWQRAIRRALWRRVKPNERRVARMRELRSRPEQQSVQPGPYIAVEAGPLLLVGIDTGIRGQIDRDQGEWLKRISRESPKPKILLTGKPLRVDGHIHPGLIEDSNETVDGIVTAPENNYIAAIGGDIHNYQRYPVRLGDGRIMQYIVSGGGGAFMHGTHRIDRVQLPGVSEEDFHCYPLRCDSLSIFSQVYRRRLRFILGNVYIPPDEADVLISEHMGVPLGRKEHEGTVVSERSRWAYDKVASRLDRGHGPAHEYTQHFFDLQGPPLFKSFLRVDASGDHVLIQCFAASGCSDEEELPPLEDAIRGTKGADGRWAWEVMPV